MATESTPLFSGATISIVLEGGPSDLSATARASRARATDTKIKVEHLGGYEHFERTGSGTQDDATAPVVFRWIARTKVAE